MNVGHCDTTGSGQSQNVPVPSTDDKKPMQRLAEARQLQGVSRRTMARRLNIDIDQVRKQEESTADLPLSVLYAWQKALDMPINELLAETGDSLASPILRRSQLVRLMKTVLAIRKQSKQESIRRMAETMAGQLIEIMPELERIGPWHTVGKRRRLDELGVTAHRRLADNVFVESDEE